MTIMRGWNNEQSYVLLLQYTCSMIFKKSPFISSKRNFSCVLKTVVTAVCEEILPVLQESGSILLRTQQNNKIQYERKWETLHNMNTPSKISSCLTYVTPLRETAIVRWTVLKQGPEMSAGSMRDDCATYFPSQQVSESQTAVIACTDVSDISAAEKRDHCVTTWTWIHITSSTPVLITGI